MTVALPAPATLRLSLLAVALGLVGPRGAAGIEAQDSSALARQRELLSKRSGGHLTPDMQQIVTTLGEVMEGIEEERSKAKDFTKAMRKECDDSLVPVNAAILRRSGIIGGLEQDLEDLNTEAAGLESTIDGLKDDVAKSTDKSKELEKKLNELRENEAKNAQLFEMGVQQINEVISKASILEKRKKVIKRVSPEKAQYNEQVSNLQQLGRQLSFGNPNDSGAVESPSFVQTAAASSDSVARGPETVLVVDKADIMKAQNNTRTAFESEEKQLLDLIDIEKKRLAVLEASLKDQQPILTEKLKQASETSSLFEMASRNLGRDRVLKNLTTVWCNKISGGVDLLDPLRHEIVNLVQMPIKLLQSMDMAMFLSRDLQNLRAAPTLVQVGSSSQAQSEAGTEEAEQEDDSAISMPPVPQAAADNLPQLPAASALQESAIAEGPFDKVSEMLQALISALREEANDDAAGEDMRKWCLGAVKVNKKAEVLAQGTIDMLKTEAKWTQTAMGRLSDLVSFLSDEVPRLKAGTQKALGMLQSMDTQVKAETKDRLLTKDIVQRSIVVLIELCELDDSQLMLLGNKSAPIRQAAPPAFLQTASRQKAMSVTGKGSQCAEAAKTLREAVTKIVEVNSVHASYMEEFASQSDDIQAIITTSTEERSADLTRCKAAEAKRASDLAVAQEDLRHKTRDLALLSEEIRELEQSCGPRAETHEERMARRADEIEAMRNALSVLEGESIPVEYSLLATGERHKLRRR